MDITYIITFCLGDCTLGEAGWQGRGLVKRERVLMLYSLNRIKG